MPLSAELEAKIDAAMGGLQPLTGQGEDHIWRPANKGWEALRACREVLTASAPALEDLEDVIRDALQDSIDVDWTCSTGARAVTRALAPLIVQRDLRLSLLRQSMAPEIFDLAASACARAGVFQAELKDVARELRARAAAQRAAIALAEVG